MEGYNDYKDLLKKANNILDGYSSIGTQDINDKFEIIMYMSNAIAKQINGREIVLKGGLALMDRILEERPDLARYTSDIDLFVESEAVYNLVFTNIVELLNGNDLGLKFSMTKHRERMPGTGSESFKFVVVTRDGIVHNVSIDLQVGQHGKISVCSGVRTGLYTYSNFTMLADKISVVCSDKVFRRSKDMYDIYVLSKIQGYHMDDVVSAIIDKRPEFELESKNMFSPNNLRRLEHAYDKFTGIKNKPEFTDIYKVVSNFVVPVMEAVVGGDRNLVWERGGTSWN